MFKNGWLLFLVLLCVAVLVSCGKSRMIDYENGELVKTEIQWETDEYKGQNCQWRIL